MNYLVAVAHEGNCQDVSLNMVVEGVALDCDTPAACQSSSIQSFSESEVSIMLFPQPTSDIIVLQAEIHASLPNRVSFEIFDLAGRMVFSINVFADGFINEKIDVKSWTSGCYLLRFSSDGSHHYRKVIVQSSH